MLNAEIFNLKLSQTIPRKLHSQLIIKLFFMELICFHLNKSKKCLRLKKYLALTNQIVNQYFRMAHWPNNLLKIIFVILTLQLLNYKTKMHQQEVIKLNIQIGFNSNHITNLIFNDYYLPDMQQIKRKIFKHQ